MLSFAMALPHFLSVFFHFLHTFLLHFMPFLLLLWRQLGFNFSHGLLANLLHLTVQGFHLLMFVFNDGKNLVLLLVGKAQLFGQMFQMRFWIMAVAGMFISLSPTRSGT